MKIEINVQCNVFQCFAVSLNLVLIYFQNILTSCFNRKLNLWFGGQYGNMSLHEFELYKSNFVVDVKGKFLEINFD